MPRALAPHNDWISLGEDLPNFFTEVQSLTGTVYVLASGSKPNVTDDGYELPALTMDRRTDLVGTGLRLWVRAKGSEPVAIYWMTV